MKDNRRTEAQLLSELAELRQRVTELETAKAERKTLQAKSEEALQVSETRYRRLFETAQDGILILDADTGQITDANPFVMEILGYARKELLGKELWELGFFKDIAASQAAFQELQNEGYVRYEDLPLETRDGRRIDVEFVSNVYLVDHKQVIQCNIRDNTERKWAEEAEREQRILAEALRDATAALNSTLELDKVLDLLLANVGRVVPHDAANITLIDERGEARIARARGYTEQALEKILSLRLPTASTPNLRRMAETAQPVFMPDTHADPAWIRREEFMWVCSYAGMPIRLKGQVIGFLNLESATPGFFTPAHTDHLRAFADQAAIAIENARLYNEASRYAEELEQQAMDLQARNEELDAFAHTVAHDLKNPVGLVIGFAEILARGYTAMSEDERKQCVQAVMQQGHKMNDIIDDLLLLAQVRKMQVEGEPLDMERVVAEALQGLANMVEQYQADIRMSPDWTAALGYAPWVEAVWVNYISNAIKYGGRPPHIELGVTAQDDGMVRFWVRDNGAGLTPEEQTRLFTPFTRLDQVRVKGHGLGLSIVRRIVEKLGGQVGVESQVGQGSVFSFTLPGATSPLGTAPSESR